MAVGGCTTDWYLEQLIQYKWLREHVKNATGIEMQIGDVDEIPPAWLDAILTLEIDVPAKKSMIDKNKR